MKTQFSIALIAAVISAKKLKTTKDEEEFLEFAGKFNKHYRNKEQMADRMEVFKANKERVALLKANGHSKAKFDINETADLTDDEFRQMQGVKLPDEVELPDGNQGNGNGGKSEEHRAKGRNLQSSLNWATGPHGVPVKSQGGCGSCWAFAATTVQETMQSIMTNEPVARLSEQEGVDCDGRSYGCGGGWMHNYWLMSEEIGSQLNSDYAYEAQDGGCRNQEGKHIASRAAGYGWVGYTGDADNVRRIKEQLHEGPLSIAVSAGSECWRWYSGGILTEADNCATSIDHGVVLVGYDTSEDGIEHWIVQNSWGSWWGADGFVKMEVTEGHGVSGMNWYVQHMTVQQGYPEEQDNGETDPEPEPEVPGCDVDESQGPYGPHTCWMDDHCSGYRECSAWGWCHGESYCDGTPIPDQCAIDESQNEKGPNQCWDSFDCHGDRTCSIWGWCQGESNC